MTEGDIVVCDDEPGLRDTLMEYLEARGYRVRGACDGEALSRLLAARKPDLVVLDKRMPKGDGIAALKSIRADSSLPVIMLTAADEPVDRILGLELGADDYVGKPVDLRELEARIRAVLRRGSHVSEQAAEGSVTFAGLTLDLSGARLYAPDGEEIPLTAMEFALLRTFLKNRGRVLTRDQLLEQAHDRSWDPFDRSIDLRISRMRRKIEPKTGGRKVIRTVRGLGYVFDAETAPA